MLKLPIQTGGGDAMSDQRVLAELMRINRNLEIIIGLLRDQQPQFSQVEYYVGGCDHQWVPTESQYTGPVAMHCAKCGAIRA